MYQVYVHMKLFLEPDKDFDRFDQLRSIYKLKKTFLKTIKTKEMVI